MTGPISVRADIIPYAEEYAPVVRSWIDSEETLFNVCRGKEYPPAEDIVVSWQRDDVSSFIMLADRKPVAYGELWTRANERAVEICHLIVEPFKRGNGFGTKMLELLYQRAADRPNTIKVVINLYGENDEALGCYLKAGFELLGTTTHTMGLRMVRIVK
jgi:ribosomal protein S18 acetylase RimI-like enzyme